MNHKLLLISIGINSLNYQLIIYIYIYVNLQNYFKDKTIRNSLI
jgi:hypothetical protein